MTAALLGNERNPPPAEQTKHAKFALSLLSTPEFLLPFAPTQQNPAKPFTQLNVLLHLTSNTRLSIHLNGDHYKFTVCHLSLSLLFSISVLSALSSFPSV